MILYLKMVRTIIRKCFQKSTTTLKKKEKQYTDVYTDGLKFFFYYSSESGEKTIKHHIMISFLKRKRFIKAKIIDYYLSNGRDIHQNYCAIILKNIKYHQSSIKYIIIYISYLQIDILIVSTPAFVLLDDVIFKRLRTIIFPQ